MMVDGNEHEKTERTGTHRDSVRTCAGCGKHAAPDELVRVIADLSSGEIAVDVARNASGRGGNVHPSAPCVAKALRGGFARVFKTKITSTPQAVGAQIVDSVDRRIDGLLGGAKRGKLLAIGADAVKEAWNERKARLIVVAKNAAAAAAQSEVQNAVASGKAIGWMDKAHLGALFGRDEVAVVAVLDDGVATEIARMFGISLPFRSEAWWSEVR